MVFTHVGHRSGRACDPLARSYPVCIARHPTAIGGRDSVLEFRPGAPRELGYDAVHVPNRLRAAVSAAGPGCVYGSDDRGCDADLALARFVDARGGAGAARHDDGHRGLRLPRGLANAYPMGGDALCAAGARPREAVARLADPPPLPRRWLIGAAIMRFGSLLFRGALGYLPALLL